MIPAGYIDGIVAWATRPDLSAEAKAERQQMLLDQHDLLVGGQLTAKDGKVLTSGSLNGKSFTWLTTLTKEEKVVVITAVLRALGLLDPLTAVPRVTYGNFENLTR